MTFTAPARRLGTLERPDCTITYEVTGSGPPIVFAHGLGGCYLSWFQQVAHFARRYTCIAFSHRGFFPSTAPAGGPDPRDYAADLAALVDHLGLGDIALVCQSMGGWTGVEYALARPGRVAALVLAATTGSLDPWQMAEPARGRLEDWNAESAKARTAMAAQNIHPAAGPAMAARQPAMHHLYAQLDRLSAGLDKEALRARMGEMRRRPPADLAAAKCPVLFIPNGQDQVIPPFALTAMAPEIPGARVAPIPDAAHSAYFEAPAAFNALVEAFLAEVGHAG
ncbi:alpha/beta fold hydrolase [Falsiroseomonas tokyonensis]|uniref:Alpha/beta fold hydrolase n=1 Tax=Falsiroseomonas tokyonensis TaxID=430521 RepID=A0ABV7BUN9_9PROT|nr:alpha/beta hydrolase [Falsiroseomonas tokyonensis]MBU8538954.1 alpha/beta hydrolase [Falsiroseomonas tokyonensis]